MTYHSSLKPSRPAGISDIGTHGFVGGARDGYVSIGHPEDAILVMTNAAAREVRDWLCSVLGAPTTLEDDVKAAERTIIGQRKAPRAEADIEQARIFAELAAMELPVTETI